MKNLKELLDYLHKLIVLENRSNVGFVWIGKTSIANLNKLGKELYPEGITKVQKTKANIANKISRHFDKVNEPLKGIGTWGKRIHAGRVDHKEASYIEVFSAKNEYQYFCNATGNELNFAEIKQYLSLRQPTAHKYRRFKLDANVDFVSFAGKRFK
jgi:hypothetical protein